MTQILCAQCNAPVVGDAVVIAGQVIHARCRQVNDNARAGRPHPCPKCKTRGEVDDPTRTKTVEVRTDNPWCAYNGCMGCYWCRNGVERCEVPERVKCDLCEGHGFTATETRPITRTVVERWELT